MPSYPSDVPTTGDQLNSGGSAAPYIGLGLVAAGMIANHIENRKRRKKLAALRQSMMDRIDAGASSAKLGIAQGARLAQGGAAQHSINSGFANSSAASDSASNITLDAAGRMGEIDARAGRDRADVLSDTFDPGGGTDMSAVGQMSGLLLSDSLNRNRGAGGDGEGVGGSYGSATTQAAGKPSAMLTPGGDAETSSLTFKGVGDRGPEGGLLAMTGGPVTSLNVAGAMNRRRKLGVGRMTG